MADKLLPQPFPLIVLIAAGAIVAAGIIDLIASLDGLDGDDTIIALLGTLGALTLSFALVFVGAWSSHGPAWARATLLAVGAFLLVDPGLF